MHANNTSVFSVLSSFRISSRLLLSLLVSSLLHLIPVLLLVSENRKQYEAPPAPHAVVMLQLDRSPDALPGQQRSRAAPDQSPQQLAAVASIITPQAVHTTPTTTTAVQHSSLPQAAPTTSAAQQIKAPAGMTAEQHDRGDNPPQGDVVLGSISAPAFSKQTHPAYPALARRRGKEGTVLLRLHISKTGQLTKAEVLEDPGFGFAEAALEAVHASSFSPGQLHGKPVAMKALLPVRFSLR